MTRFTVLSHARRWMPERFFNVKDTVDGLIGPT